MHHPNSFANGYGRTRIRMPDVGIVSESSASMPIVLRTQNLPPYVFRRFESSSLEKRYGGSWVS